MSYLPADERSRILAEIAAKEEQLTAANAAYLRALSGSDVQSYRFDSGEGSQSASRRKPKEIADEIEALEAGLSRLRRRLSGTGVVNLNLRRRSYAR